MDCTISALELASLINNVLPRLQGYGYDSPEREAQWDVVDELAEDIARVLMVTYPQFDSSSFFTFCGLEGKTL